VLRRFSYAQAFKNRMRPSLSLYIAADLLLFVAIGAFFVVRGGIPVAAWFTPLAIAQVLFGAYVVWRRAAPNCPHCKKNIQMCSAVYCHVCGEPLRRARCEGCGVIQSWMHIFAPVGETTGNKEPIRYCPSCAVLLDTDFHRWLGGGRRA
jgi:hypothetical protein